MIPTRGRTTARTIKTTLLFNICNILYKYNNANVCTTSIEHDFKRYILNQWFTNRRRVSLIGLMCAAKKKKLFMSQTDSFFISLQNELYGLSKKEENITNFV